MAYELNIMKKPALIFFILFLLFLQSAAAVPISKYKINFEIQESGSVFEIIEMDFISEFEDNSLNYFVAGDISDVKIRNDLREIPFEIRKEARGNIIEFIIPKGTKKLFIQFNANDLVFKKDDINQFFINLKPPKSETLDIKVFLPKGYAIYRSMIFPEDAQKMTDGERIYFYWHFENRTEEVPISIKYYKLYGGFDFLWIFIFILILVIIYFILYHRKRVRSEFFKGFFEDEKRVVEILMKRGFVYQNKLEKELGFSRAKMTRILKKLEAKGLIVKEKVGKTNRIEWKK